MPSLRATLDLGDLGRQFSSRQRLKCPEFLDESYAATLLQCLECDVDWSLVLIEGERVKELRSETRAALAAEVPALARMAYQSARGGFSYYFEANRRSSPAGGSEARVRAELPPTLAELQAFFSSGTGLDFFRRITGIPELTRAELMATRYGPGHFLTFHDDDAGEKRKAAFVINLTAGWQPAWGGLLQFLSPDGDVVDTFVPRFNALHLFKVPQLHSVSLVAPFALRTRYAVSGWLYTA